MTEVGNHRIKKAEGGRRSQGETNSFQVGEPSVPGRPPNQSNRNRGQSGSPPGGGRNGRVRKTKYDQKEGHENGFYPHQGRYHRSVACPQSPEKKGLGQ